MCKHKHKIHTSDLLPRIIWRVQTAVQKACLGLIVSSRMQQIYTATQVATLEHILQHNWKTHCNTPIATHHLEGAEGVLRTNSQLTNCIQFEPFKWLLINSYSNISNLELVALIGGET